MMTVPVRTPIAVVAALTLTMPLVPDSVTDSADPLAVSADVPDFTPLRGWSMALGRQALTDHGQLLADTSRFELVGVTWTGGNAPRVEVRTHTRGSWTTWRDLHDLDEHGPDAATGEAARASTRATEPVWVGPSDGVQVRVAGGVRKGLRVVLVDPGSAPTDVADLHSASPGVAVRLAPGGFPRPWIRRRGRWDANPRLRDGGPLYSREIKQAHVHHTAGSNRYSPREVPGIIRGMYWYHTQRLGWSDIGYNYLVDRFGRVWEGRAGGIRRPVRGAHTLGFNRKSFGVAVIGNYGNVRPRARVVRSLVWLISWKMHRNNRDPAGRIGIWSQGSDRFRPGTYVRLPKVDGHRDTNQTACPGGRLYQKLPTIRRLAHARVNRFS